jgi:hypothetical protein
MLVEAAVVATLQRQGVVPDEAHAARSARIVARLAWALTQPEPIGLAYQHLEVGFNMGPNIATIPPYIPALKDGVLRRKRVSELESQSFLSPFGG